MSDPLPLVADGLTKQYGKVTVVDNVSFELHPGEVLGLLGPNGAGKTTSVKMLLGLAKPTGGTARLFGQPAGETSARRAVGYLPEIFAQPAWSTGISVLGLHAGLIGIPKNERADHIRTVLGIVGLQGRGHERVGKYSKGMRQRLGLATAIIGNPKLVVLDEPTSAMDPIGRRAVRDLINQLRDRNTAVLLNSHLLGEVEQVCDRVVVMDRGRILADRSVSALPGGGEVRVVVERVDAALVTLLSGFGMVGHHDANSVVVILDDDNAAADMIRDVVAAKYRIRAVIPLRSSLEELFVRLVADANVGHKPVKEGE